MDFFQIPDDYVPEKPLTKEQMEENTNYLLNHPLFLKEIPEDISANPHLVALQSLMEQEDPETTAQNLNKQANLRLKQGPNSHYYMSEAYKKYTEAINLKCSSKEINAKLHSNRAAINLKYKNYGKVIQDCKKALSYDEKYIKAYYRIGKAYIALKQYDQCLNILKNVNDNDIVALRNQALTLMKQETDKLNKKKQQQSNFSNKIDEYFKQKKWILGKRNQHLPEGVEIQFYQNQISIPIIIIYPQFSQFDLIAKTSEKNKIGQCIKQLFTAALPWDSKQEYSLNSIQIFLEIQEAVLLKIPKQATISQLAARAPVKGAIEILIIAKNSFADHFKQQYKIY